MSDKWNPADWVDEATSIIMGLASDWEEDDARAMAVELWESSETGAREPEAVIDDERRDWDVEE